MFAIVTSSACAIESDNEEVVSETEQELNVCGLRTGWTNSRGGGYFVGRPSGGGKYLYINADSNGAYGFLSTGTQVAVQATCTTNHFVHVYAHVPGVGGRSGWLYLHGLRQSGLADIFD